jgi:Tfp pilus assembly protein PilX
MKAIRTIRTILKRIGREEDGVGLIVAASVLLVTTILAGVALSSAGSFTRSSVKDSKGKRALAAAQAGLDVAVQRLNKVAQQPSANFNLRCVTDSEQTYNTATTPHCPASGPTSLGNGSSYTYYVSPSMNATHDASLGGTAARDAIRTECNAASTGNQRCITAIGTVGSGAAIVKRRIQVRVGPDTLFSIGGMVGFKAATINSDSSWSNGNFLFNSDSGSNGSITFGQNTNASNAPYTCFYGPSATVPGCGQTQAVPAPGLGAPSVDTLAFEATKTTNDNGTIAVGYTALGRILDVPANTALTLAAGQYNFCAVRLRNGATLQAAAGATVKVYVDSTRRGTVTGASTGCSTAAPDNVVYPGVSGNSPVMTQGDFHAGEQCSSNCVSAILNGGATPGRMEIYVYGTMAPSPAGTAPPPAGGSLDANRDSSACGNDFDWRNGSTTAADNTYIFAPNSNVHITSNTSIGGAVVGCTSKFWAISQNGQFVAPPSSLRPTGRWGALGGSWRECDSTYPGNVETGGCSG